MARRIQTTGTPPPTAGRRAPITPATDPQAILDRFKDFPAIDVISRRFNDPYDPGSLPILLKDEHPHACTNSDHQHALVPGSVKCNYRDSKTHRIVCTKPARRWYVRWFNLAQEGRNALMRSKGYVAVAVSELLSPDDVSDRYGDKAELHVRRGDRGQEILAKQPLEIYNEIKRRQRELRDKQSKDAKVLRKELADAAGKEFGDEAGQFVNDGGIKVESMKRHKTTLQEEAEAVD